MRSTAFPAARMRPVYRPVAMPGRIAVAVCTALSLSAAAAANPPTDLSRLSIEELANIEISSVSKRPEPLSAAAAAVYVITSEDIRRSGASSIPEILRLAPNLQVARVDASTYAITARGFNGSSSNKLLVLIDGRSVYSTLHSGVFWDAQDTLLEDIERIEVVSGAGGTLWGANAVNGVINILTRKSGDTQGGLLSLRAGTTADRDAGMRYGGKLGEEGTYRIYGKRFNRDHTVTASGAAVPDSWNKGQIGFRMDWAGSGDTLTLQGDAYDGSLDQRVNDDKTISGHNLLGRWSRDLQDGANLQVQAYYDRTKRNHPGTFGEVVDTYDVDVQHRFRWGDKHDIVWGAGHRQSRDAFANTTVLAFFPERFNLKMSSVFAQDSIALSERLELTLGAKLEHNSYTGLESQPNARLAWKLDHQALLWSAISRAVRTPSRLDRDFFVPSTPPFLIAGGPDFKSEKLTAYEVGYRAQPSATTSLSVSAFYNDYDRLRSVELLPGGTPTGGPFVLGNKMQGHTHGVEMWGSYRVYDWWRLTAGLSYLKKHLRLAADSTDISGTRLAGNDPKHQVSLRSNMSLPRNMAFDVALRAIGGLPNPKVPSYVAVDARLGWRVQKDVELSLAVTNLLDKSHPEFRSSAAATPNELRRVVSVKMLWNF